MNGNYNDQMGPPKYNSIYGPDNSRRSPSNPRGSINNYQAPPPPPPQNYPQNSPQPQYIYSPPRVNQALPAPKPLQPTYLMMVQTPKPQPPPQPQIIERIVEKPIYIEVQKYIDQVVEKEVPYYVDRVVEVDRPVYIDKIIEKPVEQIVYVDQIIQKPGKQIIVEKEVLVDNSDEINGYREKIRELEYALENIKRNPPVIEQPVYYEDNRRIRELQDRIEDILKDLDQFHNALIDQAKELELIKQQKRQLEAENNDLKNGPKPDSSTNPDGLKDLLRSRNNEVEALQKRLDDKQNEIDNLKKNGSNNNDPRNSNPNSLEPQAAALRNEIKRLNGIIKDKDLEIENLKSRR